jgi:glycosyltransferase involved in cell wall biosynthesis
METFCKFLAETALDAGWRVTVALSGENIYDSLQARHGDGLRVAPVEWLDATCAGDREYGRARLLERRRWFARVRPDVALFVQSSNTPFRAAIAGARLAGVPVISTHRTMAWPVENVPSRRHLFGLVPGIGLHRRRVIFKTWLTALLASHVVYNSAEVARGYETLYHFPHHRRVVIVNSVTSSLASSRASSTNHTITVGYAGRIGADKRIDILLRAVAAMQSRDVRVRIYGEGAERPLLADLASRLGIADRVEWRGVTQDKWPAYADMDIVALCSPRESSSNMVLEAMAAGKAVVATDAGGMPELIQPGVGGLCVPALDVSALAAALDRLATDADLRRRLGDRARAKALSEHDPRQVAAQWMALLNTVAGRPAAARDVACPEVYGVSPTAPGGLMS